MANGDKLVLPKDLQEQLTKAPKAVQDEVNQTLLKAQGDSEAESLLGEFQSGAMPDGVMKKLDTLVASNPLVAEKVSAVKDKIVAELANQAVKWQLKDMQAAGGLEAQAVAMTTGADPSAHLGAAATKLKQLALEELTYGTKGTEATLLKKKALKKITGIDPEPLTDVDLQAAIEKWAQGQGGNLHKTIHKLHLAVLQDAATAQAAASKSSVLSGAKKKLLEGKEPTPAQKALLATLTPEETAAFNQAVEDAKVTKAIDPQEPGNEWIKDLPDVQAPAPEAIKPDILSNLKAKQLSTPAPTPQAVAAKVVAAAKTQAAAQKAAKTPSTPAPKTAKPIPAKQAAKEPKRPPVVTKTAIPEPKTLKMQTRLGGSTGAMLAVDASGKKWVVKKGASPEHVRAEHEADDIYRALGFETPAGQLFETPEGPIKVTEFLEGGKTLAQLSPAERKKAEEKLRDGFAVDAVMGNWDVVGMGGDNVMVTPDGKIWRIDNGGSLAFRAQGTAKQGQEWNEYPTELWTMRQADKNASSAGAFGGMDIFQVARKIEAVDWSRIETMQIDPESKRILMLRASEARRVAARAIEFEANKFRADYTDKLSETAVNLRQSGVMAGAPEKLVVKSHHHIHDAAGNPFGNLRVSNKGGGAAAATMPGDYYAGTIETAIKSLAHKAINGSPITEGSAQTKANAAIALKGTLEVATKLGDPELKAMAKEYLKTIAWIEAQVAKGGVPDKPAMFKAYMPKSKPAPVVQDGRSLVQRWEADMSAKGIATTPIRDWLSSQSGNSWTPATQAAKYAFAVGMQDPQDQQYWGGNASYRTTFAKCKAEFDKVAKAVGGEEKALELFRSYHALVQETLATFRDVPWVDPERRAVLLYRTVSKEELAGSVKPPPKSGANYTKGEFVPLRGFTESHSIYKTTSIYGSNVTATAVPFSRIYGLYWLERYGGQGGSSFLGDGEAEFAANTSGLPSIFDNAFKQPGLDDQSKDATTWGVPIKHLTP
jgi:hypothetical protein